MLKQAVLCAFVACMVFRAVSAQDNVLIECDPADFPVECPEGAVVPDAPDCPCTADELKVVFAPTVDEVPDAGSTYQYNSFTDGEAVRAWVVGDIVTGPMDRNGAGQLDFGIQGWTLGVTHDADDLELTDLTYDPGPGFDAERGGFTLAHQRSDGDLREWS